MVKENSGIQMVIIMRDSGSMTRPTDRDFTHQLMDLVTSVNGKTICSMVMVKKHGPTNHHMKVNII